MGETIEMQLARELAAMNPRNINSKCFFCGVVMGGFGYETHADYCLWKRANNYVATRNAETAAPEKKSIYT